MVLRIKVVNFAPFYIEHLGEFLNLVCAHYLDCLCRLLGFLSFGELRDRLGFSAKSLSLYLQRLIKLAQKVFDVLF